jgi:hypothetical protein
MADLNPNFRASVACRGDDAALRRTADGDRLAAEL